MLTIFGKKQKGFCDGVSRRDFLRIGALGLGASSLNLSDVYRAEANQGTGIGHKSVIHIFLGGGPPHQDMWEIKTEAPREIRGEFDPISTAVADVKIGETFPQIAKNFDKFAAIRSIYGSLGAHSPFQCNTGWAPQSLQSLGGRPCFGSSVSRLQGHVDRAIPPFVGFENAGVWRDPGMPGFLGATFAPFKPTGPGMDNMKLNGVTLDRLDDRKTLRSSFDEFRRIVDAEGQAGSLDQFTERAFDVLTSSKLVEALDISKEDPRVIERYGDGKPYKFQYDGAATANDQFLMARRLVEAGVRVVTLTYGRWDSHGDNFGLVRDHGAKLDQGITALVQDLEERGLLDDVTVIAWGEFGRTPRINKTAGRDHWPQANCALLAGGGMKTGQAIGSTNRLGEVPQDRPVHIQEVHSTLYHNLGIDTSSATILDPNGRPQYLVEHAPVRELV